MNRAERQVHEPPFPDLEAVPRRLVETGRASAAVARVEVPGCWAVQAAAGSLRPGGRTGASGEALFDLASLTKPFMATLALALDRGGELPLGTPVGDVWPRAAGALARRPLEALLRHRAGFLPWAPLYRCCRDPRGVLARLLDGSLLGVAVGAYSDLGFVLWGLAAEERLGRPLGDLVRQRLLASWLAGEVYPPPPPRGRTAACALGNGREVELARRAGYRVAHREGSPAGVPQDGNARFLGGLGGHAGLFGSAAGVSRLASEWLRPGGLLEGRQVESALSGGGAYALGWARRRVRGSAGPALSAGAFGHTGFTGGSLWIDPACGRIAVLLAHRTGPDVDLQGVRRAFHRLAVRLRPPQGVGAGLPRETRP